MSTIDPIQMDMNPVPTEVDMNLVPTEVEITPVRVEESVNENNPSESNHYNTIDIEDKIPEPSPEDIPAPHLIFHLKVDTKSVTLPR